MKQKFILIAIIFSLYLMAWGQKQELFNISTKAVEGLTGEAVESANAILRDAVTKDSLYKATTFLGSSGTDDHMVPTMFIEFKIPKIPGKYLLEATAEGYDTIYREIDLSHFGKREFSMRVPDLVFYRKAKQMDEFTVTATKVKFYLKGDTLVYNADAFQLAEGSMLDALIKQLPGVELKDGGQIFVNGKKVESLLLNGKDFFRGNNNIMLDNLGAYTVKDIAVYEKLGSLSELVGQNMGDLEFVMDVRLKKEYLSGYMGNIEAGGGTANRYLGRFFGLWYTSRSRIGVVGNINNLNDSRTPGQSDSWQINQIAGDLRTKLLGLDYNISSDGERYWQFNGNTNISHTRNYNSTRQYITNFIPEGDIFETSYSNSLSRNLSIISNNNFGWRAKNKFSFQIGQTLNYQNNDNESNALSGRFREEVKDITEQLLNKIYLGEVTSFQNITLNTSLKEALIKGSVFDVGGRISSNMSFTHNPDMITLNMEGGYRENRYKNFNLYGLNYNLEDRKSETYQYIHNRPDKAWNLSLNPRYMYRFTQYGRVIFEMKYRHNENSKDSYLYDLDRLEDSGVFGILPNDYMGTLNSDQTYLSHETEDNFLISGNLNNSELFPGDRAIQYQFIPNLSYQTRSLHYKQGIFDEKIRKNSVIFDVLYSFFTFNYNKHNLVRLSFTRNSTLAPLLNMMEIADTRNPLNIYLGNTNLKNSAKNTITFTWMAHLGVQMRHSWNNMMSLESTIFENALTNGFSMDSDTGIRYYKTFNVNGNYGLRLSNTFSKSFGGKDQFNLTSTTSANFVKESDMMGSQRLNFIKTSVKNLWLAESLKLTWKVGKNHIGLNGDINWRDTRGNRGGFTNFSALNAKYGVSALINLPADFNISTDLNLFTRSGYAESYLNTTDVVWNARLSYTAKGGKWLFMLDGFDLLHQLTNVTYNVNAVGRTEIFTNVLPMYVLFHIQYRFAIQPKKQH